MTFWCFPPDSKCEWVDLRSFVKKYNRTHAKTYCRSACLDVESRNDSEPEVLLVAPDEIPIVIERKSVVWPPEHFAGHRNEHDLLHTFVGALCSRSDPFSDDVYQLVVNAISLAGRSKRDVHGVATRIADVVLAHQGEARSSGGIARAEPIPWRFRPVPSCERDESVPTRGIGIVVEVDIDLAEMVREFGRAKSGYARAVSALRGGCGEEVQEVWRLPEVSPGSILRSDSVQG